MADAQRTALPYGFAREHGILCLETGGERPRLGIRQTAAAESLLEARRALGRPVEVERLSMAEFDRRLSELYTSEGVETAGIEAATDGEDGLESLLEDMPRTADLLDTVDDAPVIRLINGLIAEAVRRRASDIHVEPFEERLAVRLRIDGVLQDVLGLSPRLAPLITSRIKVMARLDITEKRLPQDGRISLTIGGKSLDVRVSTLPARHGERVVLRLLDKEQGHFEIDALGMSGAILERYKAALEQPNGIILVTGPTGSGKTTTLYAGLARLNDQSRNILTIEDPVEYALDGVGQTQVNAKIGMSFAAGLRAILRQDPDVVMVGEIRDRETADIAVQASLTGHLVLSTVHTNSAVAAVTRLRDMGVEPFLLASTVKAILAQRLVRRLCESCKRPYAPDPGERRLLGSDAAGDVTLWAPAGCADCGHTGFAGRVGLYEIAVIDGEMRRLIHADSDEDALAAHAFAQSETLLESGVAHARAGRTSLAEVVRVCRREEAGNGGV